VGPDFDSSDAEVRAVCKVNEYPFAEPGKVQTDERQVTYPDVVLQRIRGITIQPERGDSDYRMDSFWIMCIRENF